MSIKSNPANQNQVSLQQAAAVRVPPDVKISAPNPGPAPRPGINRRFFFDTCRLLLFNGKMTTTQVKGLEAILDHWEREHAAQDDRWLAYILATAYHETDATIAPLEEYGKGAKKTYGKRVKYDGKPYPADLPIYYGRGLVQLTWWDNYKRAGDKLGLDLLRRPELAMQLDTAVRILIEGMLEGWFSGKKLPTYINGKKEDWINARYVVNKLDRANLIKGYALKFYAAISYTTA